MTALVVLDGGRLNRKIRVSAAAEQYARANGAGQRRAASQVTC